MNNHFIKNIDFSKPVETTSLVDYQKGSVISKTLTQNKYVNVTVFAFDKNEEISTHKSEGDAMVSILDGEAMITIGEESFKVKQGETIVMPANISHSLLATKKFKMILTVVFNIDK
ncbi:MAG: cupin domain-containing protein [Tepidibacter sp.]|jgi:quercetin dioxygenase-like cupin family protein|uniref:cupin domain-containing protein n=1 Tax=Tepidibacter sp. TaxID=2529387 RepID=UPI0025F88CCD|nr:cupin domain-containing protein [Tepidibacter sp.]MCT4509252.1 cupin domain-containing protein [Tepidibacter sp.]